MNEILSISLGTMGFMTVIICPFIINKIIKFKLEMAKIQSETEIRKEEIRARNQLEIEKMIQDEKKQSPVDAFPHRTRRFEDHDNNLQQEQPNTNKLKL